MQYSTLIAQIEADIYSNGAELITGDILQTVLKRMVSAWASAGAAYGGTISPDTVVPLNLDQATVYLALTAGTYEHFLDGEGDPIETTGPALVIYDGGPALIFSKTDLPSGGSGATVITNDGSDGDSVAIRLTDSQTYKRVFRIDVAGVYTGGAVIQRIGSLIIECFDQGDDICHGYYYGDDMSDILTEVAVYQDDQDSDIYYLMLTRDIILNSVTFAITPLDGGEVDAFITNAADDYTKIADATITPVGGSSDVFWCVYSSSGTGTTAAEIDAAVAAGLAVKCRYGNNDYDLSYHDPSGSVIYFGNIYDATSIYLMCRRSNNVWSSGILTLERTSNKVSTISGNETSTTKYPNTKAVADALGKIGVISQTQTWTNSAPYTYTMDNKVYGIISNDAIERFKAIGGSFNSTSGYFEANGLTDISLEEMEVIYSYAGAVTIFNNNAGNILRQFTKCPRTLLPRISNRIAAVSLLNAFRVSTAGTEWSKIESIYMDENGYITGSSLEQTIYSCRYLKYVGGNSYLAMSSSASVSLFANGCSSLVELRLKSLAKSIGFSQSPALSPASVAYMVNNSTSATITITLHATAYAAATADADVTAALAAHTNVSLASA